MAKAIIYAKQDGSLVFVNPVLSEISAYECGRRETPHGIRFLIVDTDDYPQDYEFMSAWEADFSSPSGLGVGQEQWYAEAALDGSLRSPDPDFLDSIKQGVNPYDNN
jgi:hypothetical protein